MSAQSNKLLSVVPALLFAVLLVTTTLVNFNSAHAVDVDPVNNDDFGVNVLNEPTQVDVPVENQAVEPDVDPDADSDENPAVDPDENLGENLTVDPDMDPNVDSGENLGEDTDSLGGGVSEEQAQVEVPEELVVTITDISGDGINSKLYKLHIPKIYNDVAIKSIEAEYPEDIRDQSKQYTSTQKNSQARVNIVDTNDASYTIFVPTEFYIADTRDYLIYENAHFCSDDSGWHDACWYSDDSIVKRDFFYEGENFGPWSNRSFFYNPFEYSSIIYDIDSIHFKLSALNFMSGVDPGEGNVTGQYVNLWH